MEKAASGGTFSRTYPDFLATSEPGKQLRLRVMLGRLVLHEAMRADDATHDHLTFDPIRLKRGDYVGGTTYDKGYLYLRDLRMAGRRRDHRGPHAVSD